MTAVRADRDILECSAAKSRRFDIHPVHARAVENTLINDNDTTLAFMNTGGQPLGQAALSTVTPLEREDQTGLFAAAVSDLLPPGTSLIRVALTFTRVEGASNDGYADNIELILSDYSP